MKRMTAKTLKKWRGAHLLFGLFISLVVFSQYICPAPLLAATVSMDAGTTHVEGVEFTVDVVVDMVTDLYGAAYDLSYDTEFLELIDGDETADGIQPKVVEGSLLNDQGNDTSFMRAALEDDTPGVLVLGATRSGPVLGVDTASNSVILSVSFRPKKQGTTAIMFDRQGLKDSDYNDISVNLWSGVTINIGGIPPGDFDKTGAIDLRDLILVLQVLAGISLDDPNLSADVDGDGKIGLGDAAYVMQDVAEMREPSN